MSFLAKTLKKALDITVFNEKAFTYSHRMQNESYDLVSIARQLSGLAPCRHETTKGQLISEGNFGVLESPKRQTL